MSTNHSDLSPFTQEAQFADTSMAQLHDFWRSREDGKLRSFDKTTLYWCRFIHPTPHPAILLINGRVESCCKYQELFFDLFHQGFDIYSFDHRGQGLSERLTTDRQLGHVTYFDDYIHDLDRIIQHFKLEQSSNNYVLAHSMGGAIAIRYMETHPHHPFRALALTSPMLEFNLPWYLKLIEIPVTQLMASLIRKPTYLPGHGPFAAKPFSMNILTHSQVRYQWFLNLYKNMPELKLGGPSYRWAWQSSLAMKRCYQQTHKLTLPTLLLQAGQDKIVDNHTQNRFIKKLQTTNQDVIKHILPDAKHELLFEQDHYRNQTLSRILSFFNQHSTLT